MSEVKQFRLPDVGEGLTEADIVTWHVKPGDSVTLNQVIVEIETAKAVVELPSPYEGVVTELLADRLGRCAVVLGDGLHPLQEDLKIVGRERAARVLLLEPRHLDRHGGGRLPCPAHVRTDGREVGDGIEVAAGRR